LGVERGFWHDFFVAAWPILKRAYASPVGKLTLVVLAFLLIWLDQRRITRKRPESYDPNSVKGHTLKLRDEIQVFYDNAPPLADKQKPGESRDDYLRRAFAASSQRVDYLAHGYAWRFHDRALTICYQFGERGLADGKLLDFLNRPLKDEAAYQEILAGLTRLSEHAEDATGVSNSAFKNMSFKLFREGKNRGVF
jgi:hypothetical protein